MKICFNLRKICREYCTLFFLETLYKLRHTDPKHKTEPASVKNYYPTKYKQFGLVGNVVGRINEVNQRRARLVRGWVTVCRWVNHLGM